MPNVPTFIKNHPIFKYHTIKKVFLSIGLSDCSEKINININELSLTPNKYNIIFNAMANNIISSDYDQKKEYKFDLTMPLNGHEIHFSSNAFDILTMSMRGISSCCAWDGGYRTTLVGSIIDPYFGIIYVKGSGPDTPFGSPIMYRAVVRLISFKEKYFIFFEKVYGRNESYSSYVRWLFERFIMNKCNIPILEPAAFNNDYSIPLSEPVSELRDMDVAGDPGNENRGWVSYRDSRIRYSSTVLENWDGIIQANKKDEVKNVVA